MQQACSQQQVWYNQDAEFNKYMVLQDWLSHHPITIDLKSRNQQLNINENILFHSENKQELQIGAINFLATPKYINENPKNKSTTVTKKDIYSFDTIMNNGKNILEIFPDISQEQINILTEVIEELNKKMYNQFWINTHITTKANTSQSYNSQNTWDRFQIHGINCKIVDFTHGVLFVNITDIARNIWEMVEKNKEKIQEILNNQN